MRTINTVAITCARRSQGTNCLGLTAPDAVGVDHPQPAAPWAGLRSATWCATLTPKAEAGSADMPPKSGQKQVAEVHQVGRAVGNDDDQCRDNAISVAKQPVDKINATADAATRRDPTALGLSSSVPRPRRQDQSAHLQHQLHRIAQYEVSASGQGVRPPPPNNPRSSASTWSACPTDAGRARSIMQWKPALNSFAITFARFSVDETPPGTQLATWRTGELAQHRRRRVLRNQRLGASQERWRQEHGFVWRSLAEDRPGTVDRE